MIVSCVFCGRDVNTRIPGAFERVTGWVNNAGSKGFRTEAHTDEWAHERCVDNAKRGISTAQETLGGVL